MSFLTKAFGGENKKGDGERKGFGRPLSPMKRARSLVLPVEATGKAGVPDDGALGTVKKKKKRGAALASPQNSGGDGGVGDGGGQLG